MKTKVSVVIPTYNGYHLLEKNLDSVIEIVRDGDEIFIADDNSNDETRQYLLSRFDLEKISSNLEFDFYQNKINLKNKSITFSFLANKKNLRFGANCNLAIKLVKQNYVFLLNNDVVPKTKNIFEILLKNFQKDKDVFAVSCLEYENHKKINSGKNKIWFEKGRFFHSRDKKLKSGSTAWASGGSCLLDRKKFLSIGGFDKRYYPAYWEDIDLSWQARKKGWKILFEDKALVHHNHETTNQSVFGNAKIEQMSWKNGSKFTWKNGNLKQKLLFLLYLPYWSFKRDRLLFFTILLIFLGIFFHFLNFSKLPVGFHEDEAAIGYNGFAIWQQRRDEWLNKLPISFRSFGDYKAPLSIYLNGFFTFVFGLEIWSVRLPSLIYSLLSVFFFVQLIKQLFLYLDYPKAEIDRFAWLGGFLVVFNPAHFLFSQIAYEVSLVFFLIVLALFYFFKFINTNKKTFLLLSSLVFGFSFYAYHSCKVFTPLLVLVLLIIFRKQIFKKKNFVTVFFCFFLNIILLIPLLKDSLFGDGLTRASVSFLFSEEYNFIQKFILFFKNLFFYFNPKFLLFGDNLDNWRHGTNFLGIIYPITFIFFLKGIFDSLNSFFKKNIFNRDKKISIFLFFGLFFAILPSLITFNSPHVLRSFLVLIFIIIFALLGFFNFYFHLKNQKKRKIFFYLFLVVQFCCFSLFYWHYVFIYPKKSSLDFQEGYQEVFSEIRLYLDGKSKPKVRNVYFTQKHGNPYIYTLFFNEIKPLSYHQGALFQYQFLSKFNKGDLEREKSLIVVDDDVDIDNDLAEKIIYGADGLIKFKIYLTNDLRK